MRNTKSQNEYYEMQGVKKLLTQKSPAESAGKGVIPLSNYRTYGYQRQTAYEQQTDCPRKECCCRTGLSALPETVSVAMAYVPFQECNDVYPCDKALCAGTVFPVLDKPFLAGCC